ncbi:MAG: inner membrane protein YpjD [Acidobacteriota bacterium]
MELTLQRLALAGYGIAALLSFTALASKKRWILRLVPFAAMAGVASQLAYAIPPVLRGDHILFGAIDDVLPFLTVVAAVAYLYGHWRHGLHVLGVILLPLALVLDLVSDVLPTRTLPVAAGFKDPLLIFHIVVSTMGVAALCVTFTFSVIYLVQENALKKKRDNRFFLVLPSLSGCDQALYRSMVVGFALLTVGLAAAAVWSANFRGTFRLWENQREVIGLIAWAIFGVVLYARLVRGWRGRKAALLAIAGFAAVMARVLSYPFF